MNEPYVCENCDTDMQEGLEYQWSCPECGDAFDATPEVIEEEEYNSDDKLDY